MGAPPDIPPWKATLIADVKNYVENSEGEKSDILQSLSTYIREWDENKVIL